MDPPTTKQPTTTTPQKPSTSVSQKLPTASQSATIKPSAAITSNSQAKPPVTNPKSTSTTVPPTSAKTGVAQSSQVTSSQAQSQVQPSGLKQNKIRQPSPMKTNTGSSNKPAAIKQEGSQVKTSKDQHLVQPDDHMDGQDEKLSIELTNAKRKSRDLAMQRAEVQKQLDSFKLKNESAERKGNWLKYASIIMMIIVIIQLVFVHVKLPNARQCECPKPELKPCPTPKPVDVIIDVTGDDVVIVNTDEDKRKHEDLEKKEQQEKREDQDKKKREEEKREDQDRKKREEEKREDQDRKKRKEEKRDDQKKEDQVYIDVDIHNYYFYHDNKKVENNLLLVLHSIKKLLSGEATDKNAFENQFRLDRQVQYIDQISKENLYREAFAQLMYLNHLQKERSIKRNENLEYKFNLPCVFDAHRPLRYGRDCLLEKEIILSHDRQNVEIFTQLMLRQDKISKDAYSQQDYSADSQLLSFLEQSQKLYEGENRITFAFDQLNKVLFTAEELKLIENKKH